MTTWDCPETVSSLHTPLHTRLPCSGTRERFLMHDCLVHHVRPHLGCNLIAIMRDRYAPHEAPSAEEIHITLWLCSCQAL